MTRIEELVIKSGDQQAMCELLGVSLADMQRLGLEFKVIPTPQNTENTDKWLPADFYWTFYREQFMSLGYENYVHLRNSLKKNIRGDAGGKYSMWGVIRHYGILCYEHCRLSVETFYKLKEDYLEEEYQIGSMSELKDACDNFLVGDKESDDNQCYTYAQYQTILNECF